MNNPKLENKIISLIPSKTIKDEVKRIKHKFSDIVLICTIIEDEFCTLTGGIYIN